MAARFIGGALMNFDMGYGPFEKSGPRLCPYLVRVRAGLGDEHLVAVQHVVHVGGVDVVQLRQRRRHRVRALLRFGRLVLDRRHAQRAARAPV